MNIPSLFTDRLALRPLVQADASNLHRIYQMEGVLRYFPGQPPPPFESVERYITGQEKHWEKYGYGNWGILPNDENEIIETIRRWGIALMRYRLARLERPNKI